MSDLVLIWDKKFENENTRFYCASIIKKILLLENREQ